MEIDWSACGLTEGELYSRYHETEGMQASTPSALPPSVHQLIDGKEVRLQISHKEFIFRLDSCD